MEIWVLDKAYVRQHPFNHRVCSNIEKKDNKQMNIARSLLLSLTLFAAVAIYGGAETIGQDKVLVDFNTEPLPEFIQFHNTQALEKSVDHGLVIRFHKTPWPNVYFKAPEGGWDWSAHGGIGIILYNPGETAVDVALRLDNAGADGTHFCNTLSGSVPPSQELDFRMAFKRKGGDTLWGMRGLPPTDAPAGQGDPLDLSAITAFQLFLPRPEQEQVLQVKEAYLFGSGKPDATRTPLPFVDRFGQYKHATWPGKLESEQDFETRLRDEKEGRKPEPELPDRDRFGGWAAGPRLGATGWFRTEEVNGKWWLVTPDGTLFLSFGLNCVGTGEYTFVEQRDAWFDWLPARDDPLFGGIFSQGRNAHSMADVIGGAGATFSFYTANLVRKYGASWRDPWRENSYQRLRHWGFNTLGNWSQADMMDNSPLPFTACAHIGNVKRVETAHGYWGKIIDVYDDSFAQNVDPAIAYVAGKYAANPLCIGYFVDNELAWEGVVNGVLTSAPDQLARKALIQFLTEQYGTIDALNLAWETDFDSWESLCRPKRRNEAAKKDLDAYLQRFALRYFSVIRDAIRRHAPKQLYLGCRFSMAPEPVVRACAEIADVVSFNLYYRVLPVDKWTGDQALGKPMLIGEFHFGALDRGMFHTGLVSTENQAARAAQYVTYVQSVVEHPAFVGCHWFQYVDEPVTGRWYDGENYNIGFVDVTDTPYPELTGAARDIHRRAYALRYGASQALDQ